MNKKIKIIDLILIFLTVIMFSYISLKTDYFFHTLTLFVYAFYLLWLYISHKKFFLIFIFMILYMTSNILGVYIIEVTPNMYLNELLKFSSNNNSFYLILIYHVLFIEVLRYLYKKFRFSDVQSNINNFGFVRILGGAILLIVAILFVNVIKNPYFLSGIDRFFYEEYYLNSFIIKVNNFVFYLLPITTCLILYGKKKVDHFIGYTTITIFSLYLVWIGHKFSMLLIVGYFVLLGLNFLISDKLINRYLGRFFLIIIALLVLVIVQSSVVYDRDKTENLSYLNARLAQQGQLWWAIYGNENKQRTIDKNLNDEIKTFYTIQDNESNKLNSGMYKVMREVIPENVFVQKVYSKKSRYAYSTPASIYFYFGLTGMLLFSVISAIAYFLIVKTLLSAVVNRQIITMIISGRLLFLSHFVLMQSDFDKVFSLEILGILLFFVMKYLIVHKRIIVRGKMNAENA